MTLPLRIAPQGISPQSIKRKIPVLLWAECKNTKQPYGGKDSMEKNDYNIERVEFYYNGDEEKFDRFLSSAIKEYISTDKMAVDCENSKSA